jgi:hypothetical protein
MKFFIVFIMVIAFLFLVKTGLQSDANWRATRSLTTHLAHSDSTRAAEFRALKDTLTAIHIRELQYIRGNTSIANKLHMPKWDGRKK